MRRKFAREVTKMLTDKFCEEGVSFYIDAAGFQHKYNPHDEAQSIRTMAWWLKNEGLHSHCTAKGSHVGSGGRVGHFIVAISHQKGDVLCEQCEGKINGDMFSDFIKTHFQETSTRCRVLKGKRFLQDGCPIQNRKKARQALDTVGVIKFSIPPLPPDFNPIENVVNFVKNEQFSARVKHTLEDTPTKHIAKTTESMPKKKCWRLSSQKSKG